MSFTGNLGVTHGGIFIAHSHDTVKSAGLFDEESPDSFLSKFNVIYLLSSVLSYFKGN
jgi:hypothetical protein